MFLLRILIISSNAVTTHKVKFIFSLLAIILYFLFSNELPTFSSDLFIDEELSLDIDEFRFNCRKIFNKLLHGDLHVITGDSVETTNYNRHSTSNSTTLQMNSSGQSGEASSSAQASSSGQASSSRQASSSAQASSSTQTIPLLTQDTQIKLERPFKYFMNEYIKVKNKTADAGDLINSQDLLDLRNYMANKYNALIDLEATGNKISEPVTKEVLDKLNLYERKFKGISSDIVNKCNTLDSNVNSMNNTPVSNRLASDVRRFMNETNYIDQLLNKKYSGVTEQLNKKVSFADKSAYLDINNIINK